MRLQSVCLIALITTFFSTGCTSQYFAQVSSDVLKDIRLAPDYRVERNAIWSVNSQTSIFLAKPVALLRQERRRHLLRLYQSLHFSLQQTFPDYHTHQRSLSLAEAFNHALAHDTELLFWPQLIVSENNLNSVQEMVEGTTLHSGTKYGPDVVVFQVLIYDVKTRQLIDIGTVFSRARIFADNESLPLDLIHKATIHYLKAITGRNVG